MGKGGGGGAVRCGWGVAGPDRTVIMVKHRVLLGAKRLVTELSSPTRNARLVHVVIVDGRPFKDVGLGGRVGPMGRAGARRGEAGRLKAAAFRQGEGWMLDSPHLSRGRPSRFRPQRERENLAGGANEPRIAAVFSTTVLSRSIRTVRLEIARLIADSAHQTESLLA